MDTQRLVALGVFLFSGMMLWEAWVKHNNPKAPISQVVTQAEVNKAAANNGVPQASTNVLTPTTGTGALTPVPGAIPTNGSSKGAAVRVVTDKFDIEFNTLGGDIRHLTLKEHKSAKDSSKAFHMMSDDPKVFYITQTGLVGNDLPNHNSVWESVKSEYTLKDSETELPITFTSKNAAGVLVEKTWKFKRDSYLINVEYRIKNESASAVNVGGYFQFARNNLEPSGEGSVGNPFSGITTYFGPAVYSDEKKFQKIDFSAIDKGKQEHPKQTDNGWVSIIQHYFLGVWLPPQGVKREVYTRKVSEGMYTAGVLLPVGDVAPGTSANLNMPVYLGPQDQTVLKSFADAPINAKQLDLVVDYGIFHILASPMFTVLKWIYSLVGNWGWTIVVLTILIKTIFYPLNAKAGRSMAQMKAMAPKIEALRARHGDDRVKLNQGMMELYKTEKINPMGGCLPMLVQIPVFLALYWVLIGAIELRQAPWMLWIKDLASPDPYYVLPVLYAISMFVQTRLQPQPADPVQAKVMLFMPVIFSVFFLFFPAGLVLYWFAQNLITIAQQWYINKTIEKEMALKTAKQRT